MSTSARDEGGWALAEVLVSLVIVSIALAAILGGLGTAVRASDVHRTAADADAALVSAAETVKGADYAACAEAITAYRDAARVGTPLPDGWAASAIEVTSVTCPTPNLEMVTIQVTSPRSSDPSSITVAKSSRPGSLPDPTTTTTTTPGVPSSGCVIQQLRALRSGSRVLVLVIASPKQSSCPWPLRARMSQSTTDTSLLRLGWVFLGSLDPGNQCDNRDCSVVLRDGAGVVVGTVKVRW